MAHAVVLGAGVAGLGAAITLSQRGHQVTLVERDPVGTEPAELDHRHGAPQVRHSHAFLARLRNLLRDEAPDVLAALLDHGVTELRFADHLPETMQDRSPRPGDEDLVGLACRRTTFEDVLRAQALGRHGVTLRAGHAVKGLVFAEPRGAVPHVVGVRGDGPDGEFVIDSDVVIDAGGRRSRLVEWLVAAGSPGPAVEESECGIIYLSRFYEMSEGTPFPDIEGGGLIAGDLGYLKLAVFPGDSRSFSITFAVPTADHQLRQLLTDVDGFEAAALAIPSMAPFREPGFASPITDVSVMAGLRNTWRSWIVDGVPVATGVIPIGDANVCTNPLYGRGCSLGMVNAWQAADALDAARFGSGAEFGAHEAAAALVAFDAATRAELRPWFDASVMQDRNAMAAFEQGDDRPGNGMDDLMRDGLFPASQQDPDVFRAFIRGFNLLDPPAAIMSNPVVLTAIQEAYATRDQRPAREILGPPRADLLPRLRAVHS